MKFTIDQIASMLGGEVDGSGSVEVFSIAKIQEAKAGDITFLANPKYEEHIYATHASAVIVSEAFHPKKTLTTNLIRVKDPYSSFSVLLEEYHKLISFAKSGVEEPAFIGSESAVGDDVYRGAFSYIGQHVKIGNNVKLYPHVFIGDNVIIGDNTIIYSGAKLYENCTIGNNCVIHAGAVIGSDGFGFAPQDDGSYKAIPQIGNVILEDEVSIGANTTIDCATMGSTIIRKGTKLDNLIQIAHNVEIGSNTVVAAQSGISGSSKVGSNCVIAGQVGIIGHIEIGDKVTIGAQSGVMRSIPEEGAVKLGSPVQNRGDFLKSYAVYRKLPELDKRIKQLEEKILNLPAN